MSESDVAHWSLIVSCVVGIFGVFSAVYGARAARLAKLQLDLQQRTAIAQNALGRPEVWCRLISQECPDRIMISLKLTKGRIAELTIPLVVTNKGAKVAENLTVYIRMPKTLAYNNAIELLPTKAPPFKKIESALIAEENFSTIAFSIPRRAIAKFW